MAADLSNKQQGSWLMEVRLHGRGGQGGVTCAKLLAAVYARLGKAVQTFGDYAGERSGAPIRAYTRMSDEPITNRNKLYEPDHLVVLDPSLLGADTVAGLAEGGTLLVNTPDAPEKLGERFERFRIATIDATEIARRHKIGTKSVVIVNTTIAGAFVRAMGVDFAVLEAAYAELGYGGANLAAAREAYDGVRFAQPRQTPRPRTAAPLPALTAILPLTDHVEGLAPTLKTGNWRSQTPRYVTNLAPCVAVCPAGNDVVGFVQALATKDEAAAAAILGRTTPLSAVCGRVCPGFCMQKCNRREHDGAVNVRGLERWIADHVPVAEHGIKTSDEQKHVAIVGGGPAGLSAAYTLAREGHRPVIFDGEKELGGVLRTGIPTYRLPRAALDREISDILELGVEAKLGEFLSKQRLEGLAQEYDAVILATGLQKLRGVGGPGEKLPGVEQGIRFLHRVNLEGGVKPSGHVVVLGGGNTAMDCARSALRSGAKKVTVVYRRTRDEMPAIPDEIDQAIEEGVELVFLRQPLGFVGNGKLEGVELAEVELGPPDASGRRSPVTTDRRSVLRCDVALLALGQSADLSLLPDGWTLDGGQVLVKGTRLNVFAAGDLATNDGTVAHAIGDGRRAALRALNVLGFALDVPDAKDVAKAVQPKDIRFHHFPKLDRAEEVFLPAAVRAKTFDEVSSGLRDKSDATRCFSCGDCTGCDTCLVYCPEGIIRRVDGHPSGLAAALGEALNGGPQPPRYAIDLAYCKGCGICVTECPRKGMEMSA